jgi:hypothetical protein
MWSAVGTLLLSVGVASGLWWVVPTPSETTVSTVATSSVLDPPSADAAVRSTFERYRQAMLAADGAAVPPLVSPGTIDYYGEMARLAAHGGRDEIGARPIADRLTIARLRVIRSHDQLAALDGAGLLRLGVDEGFIDAASVRDIQLGDIRFDGARADAQLIIGNEPGPVTFSFVRAGSEWLFDLVPTLVLANDVFAAQARDEGLSEDDFVFRTVELVTGTTVDGSIFDSP